ncbi:MAG: hypothetical protein ACLU38_13220 [Dysosmobacter sp.]
MVNLAHHAEQVGGAAGCLGTLARTSPRLSAIRWSPASWKLQSSPAAPPIARRRAAWRPTPSSGRTWSGPAKRRAAGCTLPPLRWCGDNGSP